MKTATSKHNANTEAAYTRSSNLEIFKYVYKRSTFSLSTYILSFLVILFLTLPSVVAIATQNLDVSAYNNAFVPGFNQGITFFYTFTIAFVFVAIKTVQNFTQEGERGIMLILLSKPLSRAKIYFHKFIGVILSGITFSLFSIFTAGIITVILVGAVSSSAPDGNFLSSSAFWNQWVNFFVLGAVWSIFLTIGITVFSFAVGLFFNSVFTLIVVILSGIITYFLGAILPILVSINTIIDFATVAADIQTQSFNGVDRVDNMAVNGLPIQTALRNRAEQLSSIDGITDLQVPEFGYAFKTGNSGSGSTQTAFDVANDVLIDAEYTTNNFSPLSLAPPIPSASDFANGNVPVFVSLGGLNVQNSAIDASNRPFSEFNTSRESEFDPNNPFINYRVYPINFADSYRSAQRIGSAVYILNLGYQINWMFANLTLQVGFPNSNNPDFSNANVPPLTVIRGNLPESNTVKAYPYANVIYRQNGGPEQTRRIVLYDENLQVPIPTSAVNATVNLSDATESFIVTGENPNVEFYSSTGLYVGYSVAGVLLITASYLKFRKKEYS